MNELEAELSGGSLTPLEIRGIIFQTLLSYGEIFDTVPATFYRELESLTASGVLVFTYMKLGATRGHGRCFYEFSKQSEEASRSQIDQMFTTYRRTDPGDFFMLSSETRMYRRVENTLNKMAWAGEIMLKREGTDIYIAKTEKYRPPDTRAIVNEMIKASFSTSKSYE